MPAIKIEYKTKLGYLFERFFMTKFTFEKLVKSEKLRNELANHSDWLIRIAKEKGFIDAAISHAKAKKRVQDELNLIPTSETRK